MTEPGIDIEAEVVKLLTGYRKERMPYLEETVGALCLRVQQAERQRCAEIADRIMRSHNQMLLDRGQITSADAETIRNLILKPEILAPNGETK